MKTWLTYLLVSGVTGNPLLGVLAVALFWLGGSSWWLGRLPDLARPFRRWSQERQLREELGQNPHNLNVRGRLGGLIATSRPAEAVELLEEVVRRAPELPLPRYGLGLAQLALGQTDAGRASIEGALAVKGDLLFGEPMVRLGDHYAGKGDWKPAIRAYEAAIEVHPTHAEAFYKAGRVAKRSGDAATARRRWEELLKVTRHAPGFKKRQDRPWRGRAWLGLRLG